MRGRSTSRLPASSTKTTREKTAAFHHPKGWTALGDVGYVDADGFLYLTDCKTYMIVSGGVIIYPQQAENVLATPLLSTRLCHDSTELRSSVHWRHEEGIGRNALGSCTPGRVRR